MVRLADVFVRGLLKNFCFKITVVLHLSFLLRSQRSRAILFRIEMLPKHLQHKAGVYFT